MKILLTHVFLFFLFNNDISKGLEGKNEKDKIAGTSISEFRGYYRRDLSLTRPYHSSNLALPHWEVMGDVEINNNEIRLTRDEQGQSGIIYSKYPVSSRDWEIMLTFSVSGRGKLFGDGLAFWYIKDIKRGTAFGLNSKFKGLGIFLDTYANEPHGQNTQFPYIYGMINNGDKEYKSNEDGMSTRLGREGCTSSFRNRDNIQTNLLIRYVGDKLSIYTDVEGEGKWNLCFSVNNVILPTGYYFALSSVTGDLHDYHDIIAFRMYEIDYTGRNEGKRVIPDDLIPQYLDEEKDIIHGENGILSFFKMLLLLFIGSALIALIVLFGSKYYKNHLLREHKRFY
uniref:L-type lectin-like domain-containing protein n=1 Tax=Parastrongyloides trichosuri TaxID=131310 RepID=A0A0N5A1W7_PARTI